MSATALRARARAVLTVDQSLALREGDVPVLYLPAAAKDRLVPTAAARRMARCRPDLQIVEVPGPHLLLQAAPIDAARAILHFL